MNTLVELWKESTIIQGVIALSTIGVMLYMVIIQQPVPDILTGVIGLVIGWYFGNKSTQQTRNMLRTLKDKIDKTDE